MKKILSFLFIVIIITPRPVFATVSPTVVFINQVRGDECCDVGSLENLKLQMDAFKNSQFPVTFTLRYDALQNPDYIDLFSSPSNSITVGGFLEITPSLAEQAQVGYQGNDDEWYEAQNAYLIGYSQQDRLKLIDQYMKIFRNNFGYYPQVTTAWMIDSFSLNYMQAKYGVKAHQITREQWGTDSYTLFGGVWHLPYQASRNWVFMPGKSGMTIMRQTGSDPLFNYFDQTSSFTTQPNDYTLDGKDFNYFENLASELLFEQPRAGFLLLGLENSIANNLQFEYLKQIQLIKLWQEEGKLKVVSSVDPIIESQFSDQNLNVVYGRDLSGQTEIETYFINTSNYRARVIIDGSNVKITDLRIYNQEFKDPYLEDSGERLGYWITPFVVDGGHLLANALQPALHSSFNLYDIKSSLVSLLPETKYQAGQLESRPDYLESAASIKFHSKSNLQVDLIDDQFIISFFDGGENHKIVFDSNQIDFYAVDIQAELFNQLNQLPIIDFDQNGGLYLSSSKLARVECKDQICSLIPDLDNFDYRLLDQSQKRVLFPEIENQPVNFDQSNIYIHNPYRLVDGAPTRLVIIPRDENGFLTRDIDQVKIVYQNEVLSPGLQHGFHGFSFFDIKESSFGKHQLFVITNNQSKKLTFYTAPNCKKSLVTCLMRPEYLWWNILAKGMEKLRSFND